MSEKKLELTGNLIHVGVIGVDSGQVMICDPCYIGSQWQDTKFENKKYLRDKDTEIEYIYPTHFANYEKKFEETHLNFLESDTENKKELSDKLTDELIKERKGKTINQLVTDGILTKLEKGNKPTGEFSYDGCCKATVSEKGAGQLNYEMGHAGAGVASSTRFGDGCYNVYAQLDEHGHTKRLIIDFGDETDDDFINESYL